MVSNTWIAVDTNSNKPYSIENTHTVKMYFNAYGLRE